MKAAIRAVCCCPTWRASILRHSKSRSPRARPGLRPMHLASYSVFALIDIVSRSQKSEVRSQKSEVRSQKSEVRSQKSEVRSQKSEVRSQKSEVYVGTFLKVSQQATHALNR